MKNSIVRFAIDDDGLLFDYKTRRLHAPFGFLDDGDGVWDLAKVRANIEAGLHIEEAYSFAAPPVAEPVTSDSEVGDEVVLEEAGSTDKVDEAAEHFLSDPALPEADPADPVEESKKDFEAEGEKAE